MNKDTAMNIEIALTATALVGVLVFCLWQAGMAGQEQRKLRHMHFSGALYKWAEKRCEAHRAGRRGAFKRLTVMPDGKLHLTCNNGTAIISEIQL